MTEKKEGNMKKNLLFIFLSFFALCIFSAIGGVLLLNNSKIEENNTEQQVEAYEYYATFNVTQDFSGFEKYGSYAVKSNGVTRTILNGSLTASISQTYSGDEPSETSNPSFGARISINRFT